MFKFERLDVWQSARKFVRCIYRVSRDFPPDETYGLTSQIRRAAVSVMLNLSEDSNAGSDKEFTRFLYMSSRSLDEVVSCLYLSLDFRFASQITFNEVYGLAENLGKQLSGLKRFLSSTR